MRGVLGRRSRAFEIGGGRPRLVAIPLAGAIAIGCVRQGEPLPVSNPPAPIADDGEGDSRPVGEDGYDLWLRYLGDESDDRLEPYRTALTALVAEGGSPTLDAAREELQQGCAGLLGRPLKLDDHVGEAGALVVGTRESSPTIAALPLAEELDGLGEGYLIRSIRVRGKPAIVVGAERDVGVLYGVFALLRRMQTRASLQDLDERSVPRIERRVLNHWDNLDRTVERGYAGASLWDWDALPAQVSQRYRDYARANASLGVNGSVLTNVNADARVLTPEYLAKVAAIADVFRPYGIRVYLTARFSAPIEIGNLPTADPLDAQVGRWWQAKANEIYAAIPDFGGFLVKANSEGQPGPQDYDRTHADGANMLADAVAPHGGVVMWRAFVYSNTEPVDRIKQAYEEFQPLDGGFRDNVMVQVKNGPLDFQPREPFHPLFGAMPNTSLALELQITKEYLGQDTHLVYLGPLFQEVLRADTHATGEGATVTRVIDGSLFGTKRTAIAGVANVGIDRNWTGSHFNQANWYAFGRMAWDPSLDAAAVAEEWTRATFSNDPQVVGSVRQMMMVSREAAVNYMTPLGLVHIMAAGHHYGPGPWVDDLPRADWTSVYYHRADADGIGFDRTGAGSNAIEQYFSPLRERYGNLATVPDELLLFFHHVGWSEQLRSGRTLWEELVQRYDEGVATVAGMRDTWSGLAGKIDQRRFTDVAEFLEIQQYEARWWRDAALAYFQTFANLPLPAGHFHPAHDLEFYRALDCPKDRTKPRCEAVYRSR
jgi:alpha-glucuronidase